MSIRLRLTIWYSSILTLTLIVSGVVVYIYLSHYLIANQKEHMQQYADEVIPKLSVYPWNVLGEEEYVFDFQPLDQFQYPGFFVQIVNKDLKVEYPYKRRASFPIPDLDSAAEQKTYYKTEHLGSNTLLVYNKPFYIALNKSAKGQFFGYVQIAVKVNDINKVLNNLLYVLALLAILIIFAATSLGWFLARKALKPIDHIIASTAQIEKGADLAKRIEYTGPQDEIGRLTNTINSMLARIQITYSELEETNIAQRRFVSDASHELRTPLTTIRGNVDLLQKMWRQIESQSSEIVDGVKNQLVEDPFSNREKLNISIEAMMDIASEAARMSRLVNDLLSLARADSGYTLQKTPIMLLPLVEDVVRKAQQLPRSAEWRIADLSALYQVQVCGDADYLQQLLFIFIENAFKYTPSGFVEIVAVRAQDQIGIRIQDSGLGMDKDDVPRIFDRFYRVDPSRGQTAGTGLGLSIAQWIIDEHQGSIEVMTRKGDGSTFIIWLPIYKPFLLQTF
ncbi:MAG: ATP-binding protein [Paenibacillaceae bacterium]